MNASATGTSKLHENRLELLLFELGTGQRFGINVLKVKEVIPCPTLTKIPDSHPSSCGVATLRGESLAVIDLAKAIGKPTSQACEGSGSVIVTEFNRQMQGFLVEKVDRIIVRDWADVLPPPKGLGAAIYSSGVTKVDDELIQILDVEKIMGEISLENIDETIAQLSIDTKFKKRILVVDDSTTARMQTSRTLDKLDVEYDLACDGKEAMSKLKSALAEEHPYGLLLSDIEMPEMDGYSLTYEVRNDPQLTHLYVLLHTSLNGAINVEKAEKAGADKVLTKFVPEELAKAVVTGLNAISG
ncbi:MAG: chemotaxis protein [Thioalkalispiraceae bacterium]|jgi:two-component system chemotaxis response regulator CheV